MAEENSSSLVVTAHCNSCGGDRNAHVKASHSSPGNDGETSWETTLEILECGGCSEISVRRRFWFSEWEDFHQDPLTGELVRTMPKKVSYWPCTHEGVQNGKTFMRSVLFA